MMGCQHSPAHWNAYGSDSTPAPIAELHNVKTDDTEEAPSVPNTTRTWDLQWQNKQQLVWPATVAGGLTPIPGSSRPQHHTRLGTSYTLCCCSAFSRQCAVPGHLVVPVRSVLCSTSTRGSGLRPLGLRKT